MNVTLINPPQVFTKSQVTAGVVPPLGILYLAAYLRKNGIGVEVIDSIGEKFNQFKNYNGSTLRGLRFDEIIKQIPKDTDLIGISSLYSSAFIVVKELVSILKKTFPEKKIVLGGAHATLLPVFNMKETEADFIVLGEGEVVLLNLCNNLNKNIENIKGLVYKSNGHICINPQQDLIQHIDDLPFPDRDLITIENYFKAAEPHGCSASGKWTTLLASRGCPYNCTFCTTPAIWRRKWRSRSVENVIKEMLELNKKYGITDFHFEDENLGLNSKWLHEFCDELIERNLNFTWQPSNGLRVETLLDENLMRKMKKSGCSLVVFTLESASNRVRNEIIKKKLNINDVEKAVQIANRVGIKSTCYFILGLPGETLKEAKQTVNYACFLAKKGLDECVMGLFSMLPGCELFNNLYEKGKIKVDYAFFKELSTIGDLALFKSWNEHIDSEQLQKLRSYGYLKFMIVKSIFHPFNILKSIINILKGSDELKSERVVRTFIKRLKVK